MPANWLWRDVFIHLLDPRRFYESCMHISIGVLFVNELKEYRKHANQEPLFPKLTLTLDDQSINSKCIKIGVIISKGLAPHHILLLIPILA